jgi:hypothetical protein
VKDKEILTMIKQNAQVVALVETLKEFARYALSFFIGWVIDNGYAFFTKSKLDPQIILYIGIAFRAADYYWHRYNKEAQPDKQGQSLGFFRF